MGKYILLVVLMTVFLSVNIRPQSKCVETTIVAININDKIFKGKYKIFLFGDEEWLEVKIVNNKFVIPNEFHGKNEISIRFVFKDYQLDFSEVFISKFGTNWFIGIEDQPPFSDEYVSSKEDPKKIKRIYYLNARSTVLLVTEYH